MGLHEVKLGDEKFGWRRLQVVGDPNTLKTTILVQTCDKPALLIGLPGEKHTDIFHSSEGLRVEMFDPPDYSSTTNNWERDWATLRSETYKLVRQKSAGEYTTVIFDGAHKAFQVCKLAAMQKYTNGALDDWDGRRGWQWVEREFLEWFSTTFYSPIQVAHWIAWSAREQTDPTAPENSKESKARSIWPDYQGRFQRTCLGETNMVYQYLEGGKPYWQIRQSDKIQGCGIRVPPEYAAQLPVRIEANWQRLKGILQPKEVKA